MYNNNNYWFEVCSVVLNFTVTGQYTTDLSKSNYSVHCFISYRVTKDSFSAYMYVSLQTT